MKVRNRTSITQQGSGKLRKTWFVVFLACVTMGFFYCIQEKSRLYHSMVEQLNQVEEAKREALQLQNDLILQIQSQSDPAWVEMLLKRHLGMVSEGEAKVYFHAE